MSDSADKDQEGWVAGFRLWQLISKAKGVEPLLAVLDDVHTTKFEILLAIWEKTADGEVTEDILEQLERLEHLLGPEKFRLSDSMKRAYCAVAVECTAKYAVAFDVDDSNYVNALKRIWLGRVRELRGNNSLMMSMDLCEWGKKLADAACDSNLLGSLKRANTRNDALSSLKSCVYDLWRLVGSSFIIFVESLLQKSQEGYNTRDDSVRNVDRQVDHDKSDVSLEIREVSTTEYNRKLKKLRADMLGLQALVSDPLPDTLRMAKALALQVAENDMMERRPHENMPVNRDPENRVDSVDDSVEGTPIYSRPHLASSKKISVSPLKQPEPSGRIVHRRPKVAWTEEEVSILRQGVGRFGKAWKAIKEAYPIELARRTEVDLKDKWRLGCNH